MRFGINTLDDFELFNKTVFVRVDINQPIDKQNNCLKDTTRVRACIPTIAEISDAGAKVVILAHQGSDIEYKNFYTTEPHAKVLSGFLNKEVKFIDDVCGPCARQAIAELASGEILLLDNVRFVSEEQTLFEMKLKLNHEQQSQTLLVQKLSPLADLYVCDAFAAAHRDQPSLCGFEMLLPSAMGRLFEKEYCVISELMCSPKRPCVFVLGGAKISDAFMMMNTVLDNGVADKVLTGGLVSNIMLFASGQDIGAGSMDFIVKSGYENYIEDAKEILKKHGDKIVLPTDLAYSNDANKRIEVDINDMPNANAFLDIGSKTVKLYAEIINSAKTVFVNGPMGVFEKEETELGTKEIWTALANTQAYTVIGGGDSITATNKYNYADKISYICTGGGALIRFLTGEELPVVSALRTSAKRFNKTEEK